MSRIPSVNDVLNGDLLSAEEITEIASRVVERLEGHYSSLGIRFVVFGSVARGDVVSGRSDIDICAATPMSRFSPSYITSTDIQARISEFIKPLGKSLGITALSCASRREDHILDDCYTSAEFSPTTYDHFGLLSRNQRFPSEIRKLYAGIQTDIRTHSRTGTQERLRDLEHYVEYCLRSLQDLPWTVDETRWDSHEPALTTLASLENSAYHTLRKLAGLAKILPDTDGKADLRQCFQGRQVPFFDELIILFEPIYQFGQGCQHQLVACMEGGDITRYAVFLNNSLGKLARSCSDFLKAVQSRIENKTLLEEISSYDRGAEKTVIVADRFLERIQDYRQERICCAVSWAAVGQKIYCALPSRAFITFPGQEPARVYNFRGDNIYGFRLNRRLITAEGRLEINFSADPPSLYVVKTWPCHSDYQSVADAAQATVFNQLRQVLPDDIVAAPAV